MRCPNSAFLLSNLGFAMAFCPPPGPLLAPPKITSSTSNFSIPDSAFDGLSFATNHTFAIKASIGNAEVYSHQYSPPGREVPQSLHETKIRIASVTKLFTVLAVLLSEGKIGWEDPITKYVEGLNEDLYGQVTISALAGQTSGLGRFGYVGDLSFVPNFDPTQLGIPRVNSTLPGCDAMPGARACTKPQVLDMFNDPAYRPYSVNSGPMYSNIGFNLLGMALAAVHGKPFEQVVEHLIFKPLGMSKSTFATPDDDGSAILPRNPADAWFVPDFANFNPTGGIWSTPNDMLLFLQSILHHKILPAPVTRKWLQPRALLPSLHQLVGAPWEIFRPTDLDVAFARPIDVYTKAGGVNGYASHAVVIPEFDLAITIHAAGNQATTVVTELLPLILPPLVAHADRLARSQAASKYAGTYQVADSNNTITLAVDDGPGIAITAFHMNGVPVLRSLAAIRAVDPANFSARLYSTDPDSIGSAKESWRILLDQVEREKGFAEMQCASWNWGDPYRYVGEPLDTVVFTIEAEDAIAIELLGWRQTLTKQQQ